MQNDHHSATKPITSPAEAIKGMGQKIAESVREELVGGVASEFVRQLLGPSERKRSREEEVERINWERRERRERRTPILREHLLYVGEKREIRQRIEVILTEIRRITQETRGLERQVKNFVVEEAPQKPGVYHLFFFGRILQVLQKARRMIEDAAIWLAVWQTRMRKKGLLAGYGFSRGRKSITACIQQMLGSEMGVARTGA